MKKLIIVIVIFILLCLAFISKPIQERFDRFTESNESHDREVIHKFLSR